MRSAPGPGRITMRYAPLALLAALAGCGSPAPERAAKPMTAPPARQASAFDALKTPEEKIRYIERSNAPKAEKERAIAMIKSGKM